MTLSEFLIESTTPDDDPTHAPDDIREAWQIDNDNKASWALRKLARANQEIDRINAAADAEVARVEEWRRDTLKGPQRDADFFSDKLTMWHAVNIRQAALEAGVSEWTDEALSEVWPKLKKERKLPAGKVSARKNPDKIEVTDEDAFVTWAWDAGLLEFVRVKPNVSELKKLHADGSSLITGDGEVVPGVQRTPGALSFTAKSTTDEMPGWDPMPEDET